MWNAVAENMETKGDIERLWVSNEWSGSYSASRAYTDGLQQDELALEEDSVKIADVLGGSG